jgi:dolichyl-phosphate beta-glucosyltransferase
MPRDVTAPDLTTEPLVSIVVPAYNEAVRLPNSLRHITTYLETQPYGWEVVVVDDGSLDETAPLAEEYSASYSVPENVRIIRNPHCGKAYAVRTGIFEARGRHVIICDADLSMPIDEIYKFLPVLEAGYDVALGSREGLGAHRYGEPFYRHLMGRVFNYLVRLMIVGRYKDTQCGFKGFRRSSAKEMFGRLRLYCSPEKVNGPMVTGFDVEVLHVAHKAGYKVKEIPIEWHYRPGSKVNPLKDTMRMVRDVAQVRLNDLRGLYDGK